MPMRNIRRLPMLFACAPLLLAGACGGARITDLAQGPAPAQPPTRLIVEAGVAPGADPTSDVLLEHAARKVRLDLTRRPEREGFEIVEVASAQAPADVGVLQVLLIDVDPGSRTRRMLIGFGAGRASVEASVRFIPAPLSSPQLSLSAESLSRRRPSLILPIGMAAAGGSTALIPIGLSLVAESRAGVDREVGRLNAEVLNQLKATYRSSHWVWPSMARRNDGLPAETTPLNGFRT